METYLNQFRAQVTRTLTKQLQVTKQIQSQEQASLLTLFYAEAKMHKSQLKFNLLKDLLAQKGVEKEWIEKARSEATSLLTIIKDQTKSLTNVKNDTVNTSVGIDATNQLMEKLTADLKSIESIMLATDIDSLIAQKTTSLVKEITALHQQVEKLTKENLSMIADIEPLGNNSMAQAKTINQKVDNLKNEIYQQYTNLYGIYTQSQQELCLSAAKVDMSTGDFTLSRRQAQQVISTTQKTKEELNLGLTIVTEGVKQFTVSFHPYAYGEVENYKVFLVKEIIAPTIDLQKIEQVLSEKEDKRWVTIPNQQKEIQQVIKRAALNDIENQPIKEGERYVVFVLITLTNEYKKRVNNFQNILSAASDVFQLLHQLIAPTSKQINLPQGKSNIVEFTCDQLINVEVEYRCMWWPMIDNKFNLTIAQQIEAGNYTVAKKVVVELKTKNKVVGEISITNDTTDVFGEYLQPGNKYVPIIYALPKGPEALSNQYLEAISPISDVLTYSPQKLPQAKVIPPKLTTYKPTQDINELTQQITHAAYEVEQQQAILNSLINKKQGNDLLNHWTEKNKSVSEQNEKDILSVVQQLLKLSMAHHQRLQVLKVFKAKLSNQSKVWSDITQHLIIQMEMLNLLATTIVKQKALNPLLPDELVNKLTSASQYAPQVVNHLLADMNNTYDTINDAAFLSPDTVTFQLKSLEITIQKLIPVIEQDNKEVKSIYQDVQSIAQTLNSKVDLATQLLADKESQYHSLQQQLQASAQVLSSS